MKGKRTKFWLRVKSKAESLIVNSVGQRPTRLDNLCNCQAESLTSNWQHPFRAYVEKSSLIHRALPCANDFKTFSLVKIKNFVCPINNVLIITDMRKKTILCFLFPVLFFLTTCGREEMRQTIPFAPVNFRINLNGQDHALRNPLTYKTFTQRRLETDRIGLGGLLIVSVFCHINENRLFAFDLACPCQGRPDVRVTPTGTGRAICKTCGSEFITMHGLGSVYSGSTRPLQVYNVLSQGGGVFVVRNWAF